MKRLQTALYPWVLLVLLSSFAIYPALRDPIEEHSYDAAVFHVYRGVLFSAARAEGVLYPRWVQTINAGLGGPLFSFYPPLTYYAMDVVHLLGWPHTIAWRILVAGSLLVASTGCFALVRGYTHRTDAAIASGVIFLYSFPLLREVFERGSPEGFAVALYPWTLWAMLRVVEQPSGIRVGILACLWAVLFLTHSLSAVFLLPLFALLTILLARPHRYRGVLVASVGLFLGLALSAFYLLPFAFEERYVQLSNAVQIDYGQVAKNSVSLQSLLSFPLPYDVGLDNNSIGERIGPLMGLLLLVGALAGAWRWTRTRGRPELLLTALSIFGLVVLELQTASSNVIWESLPILAFVQIRSRLLGLVALAAAMAAGPLIAMLRARWRSLACSLLVAGAILPAVPVLYPELQYRYGSFSSAPTPSEAQSFSIAEGVPGLTAFDEFAPIWRTLPFTVEEQRKGDSEIVANLPDGGRVLDEKLGTGRAQATFDLPVPFDAQIRILYFPGWAGYVDGGSVRVGPMDETGYIVVPGIPAGRHTLTLRYEGTSLQAVGSIVSAVAALTLLLGLLIWRPKEADRVTPIPVKPHWELLSVLALAVIVKASFLDSQTNLFRGRTGCPSPIATFENTIALCGIELGDRVSAARGGTIDVTFYWKESGTVNRELDTFVQLLGESFNPRTGNPLWGQQNKQLPGDHPSVRWTSGKIYRDSYRIEVDPNAPPGDYQLEIGWWSPGENRRLRPEILNPGKRLSISHISSLHLSGIVIR